MKFTLALILVGLILFATRIDAREIGFIEDFSLADDRAKVLEHLIPGTESYYYFHCLHAQHKGDHKKVRALLETWIKRKGYTQKVQEIVNRQALLEYNQHPDRSLKHIRRELGLNFNHQRETAIHKTDLSETLDPELISFVRLTDRVLDDYSNLDGFEDSGLERINVERLDPDRRRDFLSRLQRPDFPGLAELVAADLAAKHSGGFGSQPIHHRLLKSQLDTCRRLIPQLMEDPTFVEVYLARLAPSADTDIHQDTRARGDYLSRLWAFAKDLPPAHNSLKVHLLYHLLDFERQMGQYDLDRFMAYVQLPRNIFYMNADYLRTGNLRYVLADLAADFAPSTLLPPVLDDKGLLEDYLGHFLAKAEDYKIFARFLDADYLKKVFVTTKILAGLGDMEQWYSMMDPQQYQALKDRVDIDFEPTNQRYFALNDPVSLKVAIKNVETLIVKVFEINTFNYYRKYLREVDTAINLDGLTATWEEVIRYEDAPLSRVTRSFDFPQIAKPGVFVIEFIGNGKSSRAVICKGKLRYISQIGAAGHDVIIVDEDNRPRPDAILWMAGREYRPDGEGVITIPFSRVPGEERVILKTDEVCTLASFHLTGEGYTLSAGFHIDRESILKRQTTKVWLRPQLAVNGYPVDLGLLEDIRLEITSLDNDGVSTTKTVTDLKLEEEQEVFYEFNVPENLSQLRFSLKAQVENISRGKKEELSDGALFNLNLVDQSLLTHQIVFSHEDGRYVAAVLGKNGEASTAHPVQFEIKHRFFKDPVRVTLKSDAHGRVHLGSLPDIQWIRAEESSGGSYTFHPMAGACRYPQRIHQEADRPLQIPIMENGAKSLRHRIALFEKRRGIWVTDHLDAVRLKGGFLEIKALAPGDYDLFIKEKETRIELKLTKGVVRENAIFSTHRILTLSDPTPLQISKIDISKSKLKIALTNAGPETRLHLVATRFLPAFDAFGGLTAGSWPNPHEIRFTQPVSHYLAGRRIGDEYRYILDRKYAHTFPGNMLKRPELLLNPWSIRKTETVIDQAMAGEDLASESAALDEAPSATRDKSMRREGLESFVNLDFLETPSLQLVNLTPDANGMITIERKKLGNHQQVHLVAVDGEHTVYREISLPPAKMTRRDLRLTKKLEAAKHFTEQKRISFLKPGDTFRLLDLTTSEFEFYDSLDKVYQLFITLSGDATLTTFGFILQWDQMSMEEKQAAVSKHACHELHFFLYHKDRAFFDAAIKPYIANKRDKTFMDHWLLGADLSAYLEPWAFGRLNIVEKILLLRSTSMGKERAGRYLEELMAMVMPDLDLDNHLFDTALKGRAFEDDGHGLEADRSMVREMLGGVADEEMQGAALMEAEMDDQAPPMSAPEPMPVVAAQEKSKAAPAPPQPPSKKMRARKRMLEKRKAQRQFYQKLDKTREWVENNYYHLPVESQGSDLITVNPFWLDFARSTPEKPFYSIHLAHAHSNFTEMMLALALLDLPFRAGEHPTTIKDISFSLNASGPGIVFHKEILPAKATTDKTPILVSQNYFRPDDRYDYPENERRDKFVRDEFLYRIPYGCQVVLSNQTSSPQKINLLLQIPQGAMPLKNGFYTKSMPATLEPFGTLTIEYYFYFPDTGSFGGYPAQASKNEAFIAGASPGKFKVVAALSRVDKDSWHYISQNGNANQVLDYLKNHNLNRVDLARIAFRMKQKDFFTKVIEVLSKRMVYDHTLWSYGIYHNVPEIISAYLAHSPFADHCGLYIASPILELDSVDRTIYQHMEYKPLVNARAHRLGPKWKILNDRFFDQYISFLNLLSYKAQLGNDDLLAVCYYLLLQDRVEKAIHYFNRIDRGAVQSPLQYDYLSVYLDFYREDIQGARQTALKYQNYIIPRWRSLFEDALTQLDEISGKSVPQADREDRDRRMDHLAASEAALDFTIEARKITISYRNLTACQVNYYPMDIELLFSRNPFVQQQSDHFAFIRPNTHKTIVLPKGGDAFTIDLPDQFRNSNLMVEIVAGGIKRAKTYYANSLDVQIAENYGQLTVSHATTGRPLPKTYIKAYVRTKEGRVTFYKDGYTDLRGRFDYVSLSTDELSQVERFALLILNPQFGAVIREAGVPQQ